MLASAVTVAVALMVGSGSVYYFQKLKSIIGAVPAVTFGMKYYNYERKARGRHKARQGAGWLALRAEGASGFGADNQPSDSDGAGALEQNLRLRLRLGPLRFAVFFAISCGEARWVTSAQLSALMCWLRWGVVS